VEGDAVAKASFDVAVEAVVGGIQLAILKPLVERSSRVVERFRERFEPVQLERPLCPPRWRVGRGLSVDRGVAQSCCRYEVFRRSKAWLLQQCCKSLF